MPKCVSLVFLGQTEESKARTKENLSKSRSFIIKLFIYGSKLYLGIKMSDTKSERCFDDSMSSLSSSKYMVKLIIYMVTKK